MVNRRLLILGSTLTLVGLLAMWLVNQELVGSSAVSARGPRGVYLKLKQQQQRRTGCPDNPRREDLTELLRAWTITSEQHNVSYTIAYGSLLGAMRNKDLIPWDTDIDIMIDRKYFPILKRWSEEQKFTKADGSIRLAIQEGSVLGIPEEQRTRHNCQGKVATHMEDQCSFLEPMARLVRGSSFLDFFHFYEKGYMVEEPGENKIKQYNKTDLYPFRSCSFMGLNTSCPNRPWEILRAYYKNDNFEPTKICNNGTWVDN